MKPPTYISIVLDKIRIEYLSEEIRDKIIKLGLSIEKDKSNRDAIPFKNEGDLHTNQDFINIFSLLNKAGIAFGEDYKQMYSPAESMRTLQSQGKITAPFTSIAWKGPGEWFTTVNVKPPN